MALKNSKRQENAADKKKKRSTVSRLQIKSSYKRKNFKNQECVKTTLQANAVNELVELDNPRASSSSSCTADDVDTTLNHSLMSEMSIRRQSLQKRVQNKATNDRKNSKNNNSPSTASLNSASNTQEQTTEPQITHHLDVVIVDLEANENQASSSLSGTVHDVNSTLIVPLASETRKRKRQPSQRPVQPKVSDGIENSKKKKSLNIVFSTQRQTAEPQATHHLDVTIVDLEANENQASSSFSGTVNDVNTTLIVPLASETRKRKRQPSQRRVEPKVSDGSKNSKKKKSPSTTSLNSVSSTQGQIVEPKDSYLLDATVVDLEAGENKKDILISKGLDCVICLDTQILDEFVFLVCGHRFHRMCNDKWMVVKKVCPLCNTSVFYGVEEFSRRLAEYRVCHL